MIMAKPFVHSKSSVRRWGGVESDYLSIHDFFDETKAHFPDSRHRAILHSSYGIFLAEKVFGHNITNSDGKLVSVRDIGEAHILEDFGGKFIPTVQDYLENMSFPEWLNNGAGEPPPSAKNVVNRKRNRKVIEVDLNRESDISIYKKEVDRD
jgi:hypothetical protein